MTDGQLLTAQIRIGDDGVRREVGDELILLDLDSEATGSTRPLARSSRGCAAAARRPRWRRRSPLSTARASRASVTT